LSVQPRDLKVTRVPADIGIDEARLGMRLVEVAVENDVVEHHGHAEPADLDSLAAGVDQSEAQGQHARFVHPAALDAQRDTRAHRSGDVGCGEHAGSGRQRGDLLAGMGGGEVLPVGSRRLEANMNVADVDVAVAGTLRLSPGRNEVEGAVALWREVRQRLRVGPQCQVEGGGLHRGLLDRREDLLRLLRFAFLGVGGRRRQQGRESAEHQGNERQGLQKALHVMSSREITGLSWQQERPP